VPIALSAQPSFCGVELDTTTIAQHRLNIDNKERSNLLPWNGQFSPQLIEVLLKTYTQVGSRILDPFVGSGTVLHEAARCGNPVFGSDINPAAFKMADIYSLINLDLATRGHVVEQLGDLVGQLIPGAQPLFAVCRDRNDRPLEEKLSGFVRLATDPHVRRLLEAMMVLLRLGESGIDERGVATAWGKLRSVIWSLPFSEAPIELANCDARSLPLARGSVDLVVTSPPYINVFNYHQQYRKSVEVMGWDLLEVARSEIGSNRKHRQNRFLTVIQYCLDMSLVLQELQRVCKPNARIIVVVGRESNVRKTRFYNGEIVANLALRCAGLQFATRQERVFQNRFGEMIYEDILHFLASSNERSLSRPGEIAEEALIAALERAPIGSQADLRDALRRIDQVGPSPLYSAPAFDGDQEPRNSHAPKRSSRLIRSMVETPDSGASRSSGRLPA
jgi:SAM-dependent methyltransferase